MKAMEELRRRISNVEDVQSIVSTMKTMAAVHVRQYEMAADAMAEYLRTIQLGFHVLLRDQPIPRHDITSHEAGGIIFGSDQGLCGQFNEDIVRYALSDIGQSSTETEWRLIVVGSRARQLVVPISDEVSRNDDRLRADRGTPEIEMLFRGPTTVDDIATLLQQLMPHVERWRNEGVGRINVYSNGRTSVTAYSPEHYQLFPISAAFLQQCKLKKWESRGLPTFAMDWNELFAAVVRQYLFVGLYRACAESRASENASRIAAMQSAEKNIERRLDELRREFNETRQAAITGEILDIATGVEALSNS